MTLRKYIFLLPIVALSACADDVLQSGPEIPADSSDDIRVGCGFDTGSDELSVESRATSGLGDVSPAEQLEWLLQPLFDGFEITYFQTPATGSSPSNKRMAKLQLVKKSGSANGYETVTEEVNGTQKTLAKYNFKEIADGTVTGKNAQWFDNGKHTFQGIYAPDAILKYGESKVPSATLTSDQSEEGNGTNYTSLTQYSAMPKDQVINATVQRVLLPFQHRLARVFAYILIDPEMKGVTLEGYNYSKAEDGTVTPDDPTTTSLRFENVKVLDYVEKKQNATTNLFDYTPHWTEARKVIPHFRAELGSINVKGDNLNADFILFKNTSTDEFVTCDDTDKWKAAYNSYTAKWNEYVNSHPIGEDFSEDDQKKGAKAYAEAESGYIMTNYGKVPVYDIIVRPTYNKDTDIMYDEKDPNENITNSIDFTLKLSNGLEYEKRFKFDLNPNQMTVVYLRINREQIDYNTSGAEKWISNAFDDGYYGVNNENGNRLSLAGGSWQRAYRNSKRSEPDNITDGSDYNEDKEEDHITGENGQYISDEKWIARFFEAKEGGSHHGDYFILDKDITIPASSIPADFVFTGHLDGRGHTITISAASPGEGGEGPSTRDEDIGSGGGSASKPYLFAGLNAHYTTAQETAEDPKSVIWEANVHKENGKWVPVAGYRAEVLNTTVSGARMFKEGASMGKADGYIDAETHATKYYDIDGYVFNCYDITGKKVENIQDIPNY